MQLSVLHDVDVPLCGPDGAAALFGPQKGLRPQDVEPFDRALARLGAAFGGDVAQRPGAGAAGGLGAALYALGADARSGCDAVIELVGLRRALAGAALCLTAEGSVDRQSAHGKTVAGVLGACRGAGVPCVVLGGKVSAEAIAPLRALGARDVRAIGPAGRPLAVALAAARAELAAAAEAAVARALTDAPRPVALRLAHAAREREVHVLLDQVVLRDLLDAALAEPVHDALDEPLGRRRAGRDADGLDALEPAVEDLRFVVDQVRLARRGRASRRPGAASSTSSPSRSRARGRPRARVT